MTLSKFRKSRYFCQDLRTLFPDSFESGEPVSGFVYENNFFIECSLKCFIVLMGNSEQWFDSLEKAEKSLFDYSRGL